MSAGKQLSFAEKLMAGKLGKEEKKKWYEVDVKDEMEELVDY